MTLALRLDGIVPTALPIRLGVSDEARKVNELFAASRISTPNVSQSEWIGAALDGLRSALSEAREIGWDGHAAKPADAQAFVKAVWFLTYLPLSLPVPEMAVDVDGDIALEWDRGPRRIFSVRVSGDGTLNFAVLDGASVIHGSEPLRQSIPSTVRAGIDRIVSQPRF